MAELLNLSTTVSAQSDAFVRGIENCRGGLRNLIASLDPAAQATDRFNRNMSTLDRALAQGKISADDYGVYVSRLRDRLSQVAGDQGRVTASTGQLRAGMQQLSYQIGDVAQGFAMGTPPMTIFIQQSGQVIQAVQLMTNSTKGFIGFLAGPWGAVLTGAVTIAATFGLSLLKMGDDAEKSKVKVDELARSIDNMLKQRGRFDLSEFSKSITYPLRDAERDLKALAPRIEAAQKKIVEARGAYRFDPEGAAAVEKMAQKDLNALLAKQASLVSTVNDLRSKEAVLLQQRNAAQKAATDRERQDAEEAAKRSSVSSSRKLDREAAAAAKQSAKETAKLAKEALKSSEQLQQRSDAALAAAFPDQNAIGALMAQMRALDDALAGTLIDPTTWAQARARFAEQVDALRQEMVTKSQGIFEVQGMVIDTTKMVDIKGLSDQTAKALEGITKRFQEQGKAADDAGNAVVNMANRSLNAISNLANSIQSGGILNILSGLFNAFGSLSQSGLFGASLGKAFKSFVPITGFRESGGPVSAGKAYVVGEKRPEVFVPDRSGYILPSVGNDNNPGRVRIEVVPSPYFNAVVDGRAQSVATPIGMRAAQAGSTDAQRTFATRQKNRIPGR